MQHLGTRRLETKRLILRRIELTDASDMYHNWASDDEVTRYLIWPSHSSEEVSHKYIQSLQKGYESDQYYDWGIELKDRRQLIGTIGGGVHLGEKSENAIKREVLEETGIDYDIDRIQDYHAFPNFYQEHLNEILESKSVKHFITDVR